MRAFWAIMVILSISVIALVSSRDEDTDGDAGVAPVVSASAGTSSRFTPGAMDADEAVDGTVIGGTTSMDAAQPSSAVSKADALPADAPIVFESFTRAEHREGHGDGRYTAPLGTFSFDIPPETASITGGAGTVDEPYRISFDVLGLAYHTFRPAADLYDMPELVESIDGQWISLTGYHIYPAALRNIEEMLLTKTEWDGCCIGIPPSPYDGVEVMLDEPLSSSMLRSSPIATVVGRLRIEPYLHEQWLLSLYVIEEARVIPEL